MSENFFSKANGLVLEVFVKGIVVFAAILVWVKNTGWEKDLTGYLIINFTGEKRDDEKVLKKKKEWKKDQVGMDVLRITETNGMGILHRRHYKTHIYSQMPILYVQLYYSRLCTIRSMPTFKPFFVFPS